jgi:hypothetical protein
MNHLSFKIFEVILMVIIALTPYLFEKVAHLRMPTGLKVSLIAFCFCALILGDVADFYGRFVWWDLLLHGLSGILLGISAYTILNAICKSGATFSAIWIICFVLGIGSLWEMMEYVTDGIFSLNSQQFLTSTGTFDESVPLPGREALRDTMEDMLMNLAGASLIAAFVIIQKGEENTHPTHHYRYISFMISELCHHWIMV